MAVGTLEQWLWDAACEVRGPLDAPKFKDYILPLVFLKRLSDVFDDEIARLADEFGGILDIGIDKSRISSRSPYYELEMRIVGEEGYPVEPRFWTQSPNPYAPADLGPCP